MHDHPRAAEILREAVEWDHVNWSKAFSFWRSRLPTDRRLKCLEVGGRRGGPSLWLASMGHSVVCSDLSNPESDAFPLHEKYGLQDKIEYAALDALSLPDEWNGTFDCVVFKSVLGGISRDGHSERRRVAIDNFHRCLKPGGFLLFAENLEGAKMHKFFRRNFVRWGASWNYLPYAELEGSFSAFSRLEWETAGFLGNFGRREWQRSLLGKLDHLFLDRVVGRTNRYISFGVAWKSA